jgi:hypothetical protein
VDQGVGPEFKSQYHKKEKEEKNNHHNSKCTQVAECLPSKHKALSSTTSTIKEKDHYTQV